MLKRFGFVMVLAALLVALPATAQARPVSSNTKLVPGVQGALVDVSVRCPEGRNFVSGGFSASSEAALDGLTVVAGRWDGKRTWTVTAQRSTNSTTPRELTALARCGKTTPKLVVERARKGPSAAAPDGTMRVQARCRRKMSAVSGGFVQPDLGRGFRGGGAVIESRRIGGESWAVSTTPFASAGSLRADAYCGRDRGTRSVSQKEFFSGQPGTTTATTEACGSEAHSGGWRIESKPNGFAPLIHASEPSGASWSTSVTDLQGGFTGSLTGYGYCP